ncbi:hypothetical protein NKG94_13265 [Micromonospora sp. M12]
MLVAMALTDSGSFGGRAAHSSQLMIQSRSVPGRPGPCREREFASDDGDGGGAEAGSQQRPAVHFGMVDVHDISSCGRRRG